MDQKQRIQHHEDEVEDGAAEEHRMEVAEQDMVDEDHRERRFSIYAQPDNVRIAIEVPGDIIIADAEDEGESQPGLEKGEIVGMLQLE